MDDNPNLEPQIIDPIPENAQEAERLELPEDGGFFALLKNVLVFLVLFLIVIGSFWISFQLGKRLLLPASRGEEKIKVDVPEPPAALQALQKAGMKDGYGGKKNPKLALNLPVAGKTAEAVKADSRPLKAAPAAVVRQAPKKAVTVDRAKKSASVAASGHYYKVQAAYFKNGKNAVRLAEKIKAEGIDTFIKKVSGGYRVQTGAFRTREEASALVSQMKQKGFEPVILYE
jgi:cell division protein FtsN